jgi:hypothetical protein
MPSGEVMTWVPLRRLETATNRLLAKTNPRHEPGKAALRLVQVMPSGEVITPPSYGGEALYRPVAVATNSPFPYVTELKDARLVMDEQFQVMPSKEYITAEFTPVGGLLLTTTKTPLPNVTSFQSTFVRHGWVVAFQVLPSVEYMIWLVCLATATYFPFPYVTLFQATSAVDNLLTQV